MENENVEGVVNEIATEQAEQVEQGGQGTEGTGEKNVSPTAEETSEDKQARGLHQAVIAERRRRQELEARLHEIEREREQATQRAARPVRSQYQSDEAFEEALLKHGQELGRTHYAQETTEQAQTRQFAERVESLIADGRSKFKDFDAAINGGLAPYLTPDLHRVLVRAGGSEVSYHLAQHPGEAARLSQMDPAEMAVEVGLIKASLKNAPAAKVVTPRTLTQERNAQGQFQPAWSGPTPLSDIFARKQ